MQKLKSISITLALACALLFNANAYSSTKVHAEINKFNNRTTYVYITDTGMKYHRAGCQYLRKSHYKISLKKAKAEGYTPCSRCNPPR